jgi:hypothetical protein
MKSRQKGLILVREVRKILEGMGEKVEGPGYGVAFFNDRMNPIHKDFFGVFDLMSFRPNCKKFTGHQVSTEHNKSTKIKALQDAKLPGWVWCRFSDEDRGAGFEVYFVDGENVTQAEMTYGIRRNPKCAVDDRAVMDW